MNGFAISSTLIGMMYNSTKISGACFNPAVAIVQTVFQNMVLEGSPALNIKNKLCYNSLWIYVFAPVIAGVLVGAWQMFNDKALKAQQTAHKEDQIYQTAA